MKIWAWKRRELPNEQREPRWGKATAMAPLGPRKQLEFDFHVTEADWFWRKEVV